MAAWKLNKNMIERAGSDVRLDLINRLETIAIQKKKQFHKPLWAFSLWVGEGKKVIKDSFLVQVCFCVSNYL